MGAVALAAACRALLDLGMDTVAAHGRALSARLWSALADIPGLRRLTLWPDPVDRVGVATFNLDGYRHPLLAAILSDEHAIGVRHGCFCAHPLMARLLGIPDASSTASRPSFARDGVPPSREPSGPASGSAPRPTTSTA